MQPIANNLPSFNTDIDSYNTAFQSLLGHFNDLVTHMQELNGMWEGEAHEEFLQTFSIDQAKVDDMNEDFNQVLEELRYADKEYETCEGKVAGLIDQLEG